MPPSSTRRRRRLAGGIRPAIAALVAALALGASATVALAGADKGREPDRQLLATQAASPGDLVAFEVPDTPQGARYALELPDGSRLAEGEDTTPPAGVRDDFEMPDLGSAPLELQLVLEVLNPDGSRWSRELSLQYQPRPQGTSGSGVPPAPSPPSLGGPPPASTVHDSGPSLPVRPKADLGGLLPTGEADPPERQRKAPARQRSEAPVRSSGEKTASEPRAGSPPHPLRPPRELRARRPPLTGGGRFLNEPRAPLDTTAPLQPHHRSPARDARVDLSSDSFPGVGWTVAWRCVAGAMALLLLLSVGVGAVVGQRRRQRQELEGALRDVL